MIKRLRRPASPEQTKPYMAALAQALDEVGVAQGEEFLVAHPRELELNPAAPGLGSFARGSSTSREAALANYPRSGSQRHAVLKHIEEGEAGATRQEIALALGLSDDSVRPRVAELLQFGWVEVAPFTRSTRFGNQAEVLVRSGRGEAGPPPEPVAAEPEQEAMFDMPAPQSPSRYHDPE